MPTLNSYLETIANPEGRFTTLDGIHAHKDAAGRVIFTVHSLAVHFPVTWRGEHYILKCLPDDSQQAAARACGLAALPGFSQSPFTGGWRYLPREMAVVDSLGHVSLHDVVIQRRPAGHGLHCLLLEGCDRSDERCAYRALAGIRDISAWLHAEGIAQTRIRPGDIHISLAEGPVLLHFDHAVIPPEGRGNHADDLPLARMALVLALLRCDPTLYRRIGQATAFSSERAERLAAAIVREGSTQPSPALYALARAVEERHISRELLHGLMDELLQQPASLGMLPAAILNLVAGAPAAVAVYPQGDETPPTLAEEPDGRWTYRAGDGKPISDKRFEWAAEFEAGRAVVCVGGQNTLIDTSGRAVLSLALECMEWDAATGVASVSADGMCGLSDRDGVMLTPLSYEWLGSWREGLLIARREDKYGFLDALGREAIPFEYDEASSFSADGTAPVRKVEEGFLIDKTGRRV